MLQLSDPHSVASKKLLDNRGFVITVLQTNDLRGIASLFGKAHEIRIGRDNCESIEGSIFPDLPVGCKSLETGIEYVSRFGKELRKSCHELGRDVRVKKKLQRR